MPDDWFGSLTGQEREAWNEFVTHARRDVVSKIADSAMVISLIPEEPDVKFAVELGFSIMLGKPIVIIVLAGRPVPAKLRQFADAVVEIDDMDSAEGQAELARKLAPFLAGPGHAGPG